MNKTRAARFEFVSPLVVAQEAPGASSVREHEYQFPVEKTHLGLSHSSRLPPARLAKGGWMYLQCTRKDKMQLSGPRELGNKGGRRGRVITKLRLGRARKAPLSVSRATFPSPPAQKAAFIRIHIAAAPPARSCAGTPSRDDP